MSFIEIAGNIAFWKRKYFLLKYNNACLKSSIVHKNSAFKYIPLNKLLA